MCVRVLSLLQAVFCVSREARKLKYGVFSVRYITYNTWTENEDLRTNTPKSPYPNNGKYGMKKLHFPLIFLNRMHYN